MLRLLSTVAAAALLLALAWSNWPGARSGARLIGGPFALQGAGDKKVTDADFKGHPFLVYFGYTHCPDVCPTTLAKIAEALRRLPATKPKVAFITVDPDRDTPALMSDYVSSFGPDFVGLSGSSEAVAAALKAFRVAAKKAPVRSPENMRWITQTSSI